LGCQGAKRTKIGERQSIEFRAQALIIFQSSELLPDAEQLGQHQRQQPVRNRNAYNDINSTNDPGSRIMEFQLRYSF
jgi:hypothetical protein